MEIFDYTGEGYAKAMSFENWRIAFLTYAERFNNITYIERHLETDEAFILLDGDAILLIGTELKQVKMDKHKIYNIPKGEWHAIKASPGAKVLIVENEDTTKDNSEYMDV